MQNARNKDVITPSRSGYRVSTRVKLPPSRIQKQDCTRGIVAMRLRDVNAGNRIVGFYFSLHVFFFSSSLSQSSLTWSDVLMFLPNRLLSYSYLYWFDSWCVLFNLQADLFKSMSNCDGGAVTDPDLRRLFLESNLFPRVSGSWRWQWYAMLACILVPGTGGKHVIAASHKVVSADIATGLVFSWQGRLSWTD